MITLLFNIKARWCTSFACLVLKMLHIIWLKSCFYLDFIIRDIMNIRIIWVWFANIFTDCYLLMPLLFTPNKSDLYSNNTFFCFFLLFSIERFLLFVFFLGGGDLLLPLVGAPGPRGVGAVWWIRPLLTIQLWEQELWPPSLLYWSRDFWPGPTNSRQAEHMELPSFLLDNKKLSFCSVIF